MSERKEYRILVVDDELSIRSTVAFLLLSEGYSVDTAEDGFDALLRMKTTLPDLIISDLNMPHMSGFEFLSVVRRRFPQVLVLAMSGAYETGECVPGGVIADAY
jgi:CheY-like chemotaxis protein